MSPERDDYLDDDDDLEKAPRPRPGGVLAAGWLRALLVLGGLAALLILSVPYIIEWVSPSAPLPGPMTRPLPAEPAKGEPAQPEPAKPEPVKPETVAPTGPTPAPAPATPPIPAPTPGPGAVAAAPPARAGAPAKPAAPRAAASTVKAAAAAPRASAGPVKSAPTATSATGDYWVQVGLFASSDNAERLAKELREERFAVEIAQTARGGSAPVNQHEVVVMGSSVEAVTAALKGTGTAEARPDMVVVRPAMDLKDAVTLSRRLAGDGLQVRIRRAAAAPGGTLYLVRVGGYATREAAATGKRELAAKGVSGFVTQGPVK